MLLLAYNRVRFGHILEFGQRDQLGNWNQLKLASSYRHRGENAWRYLLAPARYSRYFPFVSAPTWIAVSVLPHVPWLWLAPLAAWALFRKGAPGAARALGASALILAATNLLTLIFLPSGNPAAVRDERERPLPAGLPAGAGAVCRPRGPGRVRAGGPCPGGS